MPSTTLAAGLLVIGLLVGAGATYAIAPSILGQPTAATTTVTQTASGQSAITQCGCTVTIGDVTDLTGGQATYGVQNKVAVDMAIADVNAWLKSNGATLQFSVVHEDDQTDPAVALTKLQTLASLGVKVTIGPYFSGAAANMLSYAQSNHIVMISPQATSPSFDTASHPYLYLVAPTDDLGAKGLAALAINQGAQAAILIYRGDTWGTPYANFLNSSFYALGGSKVMEIPYTPVTSGTYDFSAELAQAQTDYNSLVAQYGASHVVIVNPGFDEDATLFEQAATSYPTLLNATWYNTDETTGFITTTGPSSLQTKVFADVFEPTASAKYTDFISRMQQSIGTIPNPYSTTSYDAVWLAALSIIAAGTYDGAAVQAALPGVANNYFGVSGWTSMNQYGDRYNTDYGIWQVTSSTSGPTWTQIGTYAADGSLTFTQQP